MAAITGRPLSVDKVHDGLSTLWNLQVSGKSSLCPMAKHLDCVLLDGPWSLDVMRCLP